MLVLDRSVRAPDGTRIAYNVAGSGPALVLTNGLTTTGTFWKYLRPAWLEKHTVVAWDLPGHGASEPAKTAQGASIEAQPALLARVMDAAGVERATPIGWSVGCQIVLEMYRQFPERCAAIVTVLLPGGRGVLAHSGESEPTGELVAWAERRLVADCLEDETALLTSVADDNFMSHERMNYCASALVARRDLGELVVGLLVLGFGKSAPNLVSGAVLYAIATQLLDTDASDWASLRSEVGGDPVHN